MFSILQNFINRLSLKKQKSAPQSLKKEGHTENICQEKTEKKIPEKKTDQNKNIKKSNNAKLDKNKIPIIDEHTDLNACFTEKDDNLPKVSVKEIKNTKTVKPKKRKQKPKKKHTPFPVNKNGLPILSKDEDLFKHFMDDEHDNNSDSDSGFNEKHIDKKNNIKEILEENFKEMLEKSLAGKTREMILIEKNNGLKQDKPLNKNEIIKYYPLPQDELDLHGFTAAEALEENEAFIKKTRHKGKRTVLVIVGKGTGTHGKAVLPDVIENQLLELKRKKIVLAYKWDKGIKRKSGALIVYLNIAQIN